MPTLVVLSPVAAAGRLRSGAEGFFLFFIESVGVSRSMARS
jgi:hypothetical protein